MSIDDITCDHGYDARRIPFAYFVEAIDTHIDPRNADLKLHGPTYTVALGAKPTHELGLFAVVSGLEQADRQVSVLSRNQG